VKCPKGTIEEYQQERRLVLLGGNILRFTENEWILDV